MTETQVQQWLHRVGAKGGEAAQAGPCGGCRWGNWGRKGPVLALLRKTRPDGQRQDRETVGGLGLTLSAGVGPYMNPTKPIRAHPACSQSMVLRSGFHLYPYKTQSLQSKKHGCIFKVRPCCNDVMNHRGLTSGSGFGIGLAASKSHSQP